MIRCCCGGSGTGSGGGSTIAMCDCSAVPETLTMTATVTGDDFGVFNSCTIQYGLTPSAYASLLLGAETFISVESFPDPLADDALFQYYLSCLENQFYLRRIYASSSYGTPYIGGVIYSWFVGSDGNTCSPFALTNGTVGGGGYTAVVTIT